MSLNNGKDLGDANGITTYREERFSSRLSQSGDSAPSLKTVFLANWDQPFIFDALNGRERAVTYGEFLHLSIQLGKMLETFRVDRGNTICVMMNNSVELAETYLASLISGIVVVPLDPLKGENEVKEILSYAGHKLTLCNFTGGLSDIADKKPIIKIKSFSDYADSDILSDKKDLGILDNIDAGKPFLNTFTSGSTGVPKGVIHSFRNVYLTSIAFAKRFNFNSGSVFYHNLPMTYMAGILNLFFMPMICGSKVVVGERFGIAAMPRFWDFPIKYSANTFWFIPAMLALLMKLDRGSSGVEYAKRTVITGLVGTAPLNQKLRRDFEKRYGIPLYESYGLSETLFVSTNSPKGVAGGSGDGVGKPLDMVELNFQEDKEISIGVPWMFLGYSNVDAKQSFSERNFYPEIWVNSKVPAGF